MNFVDPAILALVAVATVILVVTLRQRRLERNRVERMHRSLARAVRRESNDTPAAAA